MLTPASSHSSVLAMWDTILSHAMLIMWNKVLSCAVLTMWIDIRHHAQQCGPQFSVVCSLRVALSQPSYFVRLVF